MESTNPKTKNKKQQTGLKLQHLQALNDKQREFFKDFNKFQVISLSGYAGTGKSIVAIFKALLEIETNPETYKELLIIRSAVSSRDIGFMPGNKKDKMEVYEGPYASICTKLYGRGDAYSVLKQKKLVRFEPSSFMRGETFDNMIVLIEEAQNMSYQELYTLLTRVGNNCKVIISGDKLQDDLTSERYNERSGYGDILDVLDRIPSCKTIYFDIDDIVRSGFVRDLIIATQK